jgi:hypothetical protein
MSNVSVPSLGKENMPDMERQLLDTEKRSGYDFFRMSGGINEWIVVSSLVCIDRIER